MYRLKSQFPSIPPTQTLDGKWVLPKTMLYVVKVSATPELLSEVITPRDMLLSSHVPHFIEHILGGTLLVYHHWLITLFLLIQLLTLGTLID